MDLFMCFDAGGDCGAGRSASSFLAAFLLHLKSMPPPRPSLIKSDLLYVRMIRQCSKTLIILLCPSNKGFAKARGFINEVIMRMRPGNYATKSSEPVLPFFVQIFVFLVTVSLTFARFRLLGLQVCPLRPFGEVLLNGHPSLSTLQALMWHQILRGCSIISMTLIAMLLFGNISLASGTMCVGWARQI